MSSLLTDRFLARAFGFEPTPPRRRFESFAGKKARKAKQRNRLEQQRRRTNQAARQEAAKKSGDLDEQITWQGPNEGPQGGIYWLPEGEPDTPENRRYSQQNPGQRAKSRRVVRQKAHWWRQRVRAEIHDDIDAVFDTKVGRGIAWAIDKAFLGATYRGQSIPELTGNMVRNLASGNFERVTVTFNLAAGRGRDQMREMVKRHGQVKGSVLGTLAFVGQQLWNSRVEWFRDNRAVFGLPAAIGMEIANIVVASTVGLITSGGNFALKLARNTLGDLLDLRPFDIDPDALLGDHEDVADAVDPSEMIQPEETAEIARERVRQRRVDRLPKTYERLTPEQEAELKQLEKSKESLSQKIVSLGASLIGFSRAKLKAYQAKKAAKRKAKRRHIAKLVKRRQFGKVGRVLQSGQFAESTSTVKMDPFDAMAGVVIGQLRHDTRQAGYPLPSSITPAMLKPVLMSILAGLRYGVNSSGHQPLNPMVRS